MWGNKGIDADPEFNRKDNCGSDRTSISSISFLIYFMFCKFCKKKSATNFFYQTQVFTPHLFVPWTKWQNFYIWILKIWFLFFPAFFAGDWAGALTSWAGILISWAGAVIIKIADWGIGGIGHSITVNLCKETSNYLPLLLYSNYNDVDGGCCCWCNTRFFFIRNQFIRNQAEFFSEN